MQIPDTTLIVHADLRTMAERDYPDGFIQFCDGKITALGAMEDAPEQENAYDAKGAILLPGLVDAHCHIGMWEDGMGFEGDDGNEDTDPLTPQLRGLDGVNPMDGAFSEALDYGVTTVVTGPGSANPIAGQMLAMKTLGRRADAMVIREPLAIKMALGENPKKSYQAKDSGPVTRMAVAALIREQLAKAKKYADQLAQAAEDEELDEPEYDAKCEALLPLLDHRVKAHIHAHRADDIFTGIRLANEFDFEYVIVHGTEGHLIAQELLAEGCAVICGPLLGGRTKPELKNATPKGVGQLAQMGVPVAICTDHPELPCHYLLLSAQVAYQEGMPAEKALRAITIDAAKICGLEQQVGSLEVGKDADFVLYWEEPLQNHRLPKAVFINGKRVR